jgi:hypothetical protein
MKKFLIRYKHIIPSSLLLFFCLAGKTPEVKPDPYLNSQPEHSFIQALSMDHQLLPAVWTNEMGFINFRDAFSYVFTDAKNKFIHVRRGKPSDLIGNFHPTIWISDNSAVPENSFHRGHEWAFRFTTVVSKNDAVTIYTQIDNMIRFVLKRNSVKYNKTVLPFDHGDSPITSYQYRDMTAPLGYRVEFTRFTSGESVNQEIIIFYSDYVGYL